MTTVQLTQADLPPRLVTPGVLNHDAIDAFTHGQCHALAIALGEALDAPLAAVVAWEYKYDDQWEDIANGGADLGVLAEVWHHVVVVLDDDRFLDATGVRSCEEVLFECGATDPDLFEIVPVTADQLTALHRFGGGVAPDVEVARTFVPAVLERYLGA